MEEQRERQEHVLRLLARERKQAEEIARLEGELAKAYEERDTEIEKRDKVLTPKPFAGPPALYFSCPRAHGCKSKLETSCTC